MIGYISNVVYSIVCLSSFRNVCLCFCNEKRPLETAICHAVLGRESRPLYLISFYLAAIVYASRFYFNLYKVAQSSKVH
jgi:hypothetical protein